MVIVKVMGGLGNQMFQYALYKKLHKINKDTAMNIDYYQNKKDVYYSLIEAFPQIEINYNTKDYAKYMEINANRLFVTKCIGRLFPLSRIVYYERKDSVFDKDIFVFSNGILEGYWQTEKYWYDIRHEIINDFTFSNKYEKTLQRINAMKKDYSLVSIHIRGGDYLIKGNQKLYANICTKRYYINAIEYIKKVINNPLFIIFTNDDDYAHEIIKDSEAIYLKEIIKTDHPDWVEMMIMAACNHNIIANSTFSWWGAYLNKNPEKIIIAPNKWLNKKSTKDIWINNWIRIDG